MTSRWDVTTSHWTSIQEYDRTSRNDVNGKFLNKLHYKYKNIWQDWQDVTTSRYDGKPWRVVDDSEIKKHNKNGLWINRWIASYDINPLAPPPAHPFPCALLEEEYTLHEAYHTLYDVILFTMSYFKWFIFIFFIFTRYLFRTHTG